MNSSQGSQTRTRMFARVLGPFYVIVSVIAAVRAERARTSLLSDFGVWPWATGAFLLMAGLVVIAFHHYWGSVAAAIVSLLGWGMTLRGFFVLAFPSGAASMAGSVVGAVGLWRAVFIIGALISLYLTYVGWAPELRRSTSHAAGHTRDVSHDA